MIPTYKRKSSERDDTQKYRRSEPSVLADAQNLMSKFNYYKRLNLVIKTAFTAHHPVQESAALVSVSKGVLPIFAFDTVKGKKGFLSTSYSHFFRSYQQIVATPKWKFEASRTRCHYEVILRGLPCDMYFDLDVKTKQNPNFDIDKAQPLLFKYIRQLCVDRGLCEEEDGVTILISDSSSEVKISRHYVLKLEGGFMMKNSDHCGAFARRLCRLVQEKEGVDPATNPLFCLAKKKSGIMWETIFDLSVYTPNREFRLLFSSKSGDGRNFFPVDENGTPLYTDIKNMPRDEFLEYMAQSRLTENTPTKSLTEVDESHPRSTSNLTLFRMDVPNTSNVRREHSLIPESKIKKHYTKRYPFEEIWKDFGHPRREFGFTSRTGVYTRNKHFSTMKEFKEYVLHQLPVVVHIGSVFKSRLDSSKKTSRVVEETPLKFDIDLDVYKINDSTEPLRSCCKNQKKCCVKCWPLALIAKTVLLHIMTKEYGIPSDQVRFFFSGCKGLHAWIINKEMSTLTQFERSCVATRVSKGYEIPYLLNAISDQFTNSTLEEYCEGMGVNVDFLPTVQDKVKVLWPCLDKGPTCNSGSLMKSPYSLHMNGKIVSPLTNANPDLS